MKILGICCSPRLHGNTEIMLQEALNAAQEAGAEVELVTIAGKTISPCDSCLACLKTGKCHIKDDMQEIYTKLLEADGIIFGAPVYFWTVNAQAKALIDRTFVFSEGPNLRNKVGGVIMTTGGGTGSHALTVFSYFFNAHGMRMAEGGVIGYGHYYEKGSVKKDKRGMAEARTLGKMVAGYIRPPKASS